MSIFVKIPIKPFGFEDGKFLADDADALASPLAATMGDLVMARQLAIIRRLERETGTSAAAECRRYLGCAPEDLSRRAASALIEHLTNLARREERVV